MNITITELRKRYHNLLAIEARISDSRKLKNSDLEVWIEMLNDLLGDITKKICDRRISEKSYISLLDLYCETEILLARYMIYYDTNNGNSTEYCQHTLKSDIDILKLY